MKKGLTCPKCGKKLSVTKHYDPVFEWLECPKCEGCFTYDEIIEGGGNALEENHENGKAPIAKGKMRRTEIADDAEALAEYEKKQAKPVEVDAPKKSRDEVSTGEIVNIMADEIEELYRVFGREIDRTNSMDKALIVTRHLRTHGKVNFREKEVPHKLCKEHRG